MYPHVVSGGYLIEEVNTEFLHIYIVMDAMYDSFQEYSVKKDKFCLHFLIDWLEIQATFMQAIQHMVYITKN